MNAPCKQKREFHKLTQFSSFRRMSSLECGATARHTLLSRNFSPWASVSGGPSVQREYLIRPPARRCDRPMPLLVLVHCFGCTAELEIAKFEAAADKFGMALLAPQGIGHSFNAPHCCGPARDRRLDDVGFIDASVHAARALLPVVADAIFVSGFSNGGFMASHLANGAGRTRWRAAAPVSGHEFAVRAASPMPVFIHHCAADSMVRFDGCCAPESGEPTCCCDIGTNRRTCVSVPALHKQWFELNRCTGSRAYTSGATGAKCVAGVGCAANATLCAHANGCYHQQWARDFPAATEIVAWFASIR